ncbi:MAG TPA: hypothetical protein VKV36_06855, partial [Acidimicrobiales bacterium]|nr:hypothetical protein [Acidimicrobiales bacterium]
LAAHWRPLVVPGLLLWAMAAVVGSVLIHSVDLKEYARYAHAALQLPPLHRFPAEYPAPSVALFLLPLLLPVAYPWAFAIVVGVVLVVLLVSYDVPGLPGLDAASARRLLVYMALGTVMFVTARYDLFATAAAFWSYRAARRQRWSAAWTWSVVGAALKLYPAVLWPILLVAETRHSGRLPLRRALWAAGACAAVVGVPALLDPHAVGTVARYYVARPVEIGSTVSGLLVILDWHVHFISAFHSTDVVSHLGNWLAVPAAAAGVLGVVTTWGLYLRRRLSTEAAILASLTCIVLGSKVLSVQYLVWLMPFWALYPVRRAWMLACAVNTAVFPLSGWVTSFSGASVRTYGTLLALSFFARDLLIASGTLAWLRGELGSLGAPGVAGGQMRRS